jgi:hypothetical protein
MTYPWLLGCFMPGFMQLQGRQSTLWKIYFIFGLPVEGITQRRSLNLQEFVKK